MSTEQKLKEQVERGQRAEIAKQELESAMKALEEDCYKVFRASDIHDDAGRKACRMYLRVMDDINKRFTKAIRTGEAANTKLIQFKKPSLLRKVVNG